MSTSGAPLAAVSVHAERLQNPDVWRKVERSLPHFERREMRLTFFVSPRGAAHLGHDLTPKLRRLADGGHEIAQHTHYYNHFEMDDDGTVTKEMSMDDDNVEDCLDRDFAYLSDRGFRPIGFVSGAWSISDTVFRWLASRQFAYDCSYRTFPLHYDAPDAARGETTSAPFEHFGFLEIPTTNPLRSPLRRSGNGTYRMVYCHDYDLLKLRAALAWRALPVLFRNTRTVCARDLAGAVERLR